MNSAAARLTVDVIINNHNYDRFLGAAIESALAQTRDDVRVIVVDDGSTDGSREVIAGYDSRITPVLKPNGGQASSINAGFGRSAGELVIFLDADDVLLSDVAERIADAFAAHPEASKAQYPMAVIDDDGRRTGELKPPKRSVLPEGILWREEVAFPFDVPRMATSGNAYPRRVLERLLPMPEHEYRLGADWYLVHLTPLFGHVIALDHIGACYRVHAGNRYERREDVLDLEHVRQSVVYAAATRRHLERTADALGLPRPGGHILSVSDIGNRLISLRLDPRPHPLPHDSVSRLVVSGMRAVARRFDVGWSRKALFAGWIIAMAVARGRLAVHLAALFLFPSRRRVGMGACRG